MKNQLTIDLLRHGETTAGCCFLGSTDAPLTPRGWQQMTTAMQRISDKDNAPSLVISSPLQRCAEFADAYCQESGLELLIEKDLREIAFGDWEAKTSDELWQTDRDRLSRFWQDPLSHAPPGGENIRQLYERVTGVVESLANHYPNRHLLIIAHGGSIRCLLAWALGLSLQNLNRIALGHGSVSRIRVSREKASLLPSVEFINR